MTRNLQYKLPKDLDPKDMAEAWQDAGYNDIETARRLGCDRTAWREWRLKRGWKKPKPGDTKVVLAAPVAPPPKTEPPKPAPPAADVSVLLAENARLQKETHRLKGLRDIYERIVSAQIIAAEPVPIPRHVSPKGQHQEHVAYALIGDLQTGLRVTPSDTGGLETYGEATMQERLARYKSAVAVLLGDYRRSFPLRRACVAVGGDVVEGGRNYPGQQLQVWADNTGQVIAAATILADLARFWASQCEQVDVRAVPGNHGTEADTGLVLDYLAYYMAREMTRGQENLHWIISDAPFMAWDEEGGWLYAMAHGDKIQRNMSLPYYGIDRARKGYIEMAGVVFDTIFLFHHHESADREAQWMVNGTWVAATKYTVGTLRTSNRPNQWLLIHHPRVGITHQNRIWLADRPRLADADATGTRTPYLKEAVG